MFSRLFRQRPREGVPPVFKGEVVRADTRQPFSATRVTVMSEWREGSFHESSALTDTLGRFRIRPKPGKSFIFAAFPSEGEPYLIVQRKIDPNGDQPPPIEFALPRGVLVRGRIVEADSAKPIAGASVLYDERYDGRQQRYAPERIMPHWAPHSVVTTSDVDGRFQIAVTPGRGTLFIQGPHGEYIQQMMGAGELFGVSWPGHRYYFSAHVPLDVALDAEPPELNVAIRRGVDVQGQLVGPEGRSVGEVLMLSRLNLERNCPRFRCEAVVVRDQKFELRGLDPDVFVPVFFLDPKNHLGAVAEISGRSADDHPLVVHLEPCGNAVARFLDPQGKPLTPYEPQLHIVVSPGPFYGNEKRIKTELVADQDFVANFDREHYNPFPTTDKDGYCTFPSLIPGATYRIPLFRKPGDWDELDFSVKPWETLQLPDVILSQEEIDSLAASRR